MLVINCDEAFVGTEESADKMISEIGSAMHAHTKSHEICTAMNSRSLIVR